MNILNPQPTIENPFVVEDYPYGFTLRTQMRVYTEYRKGFGMRYTTQTLNPKTGKWNKPKSGTYAPIIIVYQDPVDNHIHPRYWNAYDEKEFNEFVEFCGDILNQEPYLHMIKMYRAYLAKRKVTPINVTVTHSEIGVSGEFVTTKVEKYTVLDNKIIS